MYGYGGSLLEYTRPSGGPPPSSLRRNLPLTIKQKAPTVEMRVIMATAKITNKNDFLLKILVFLTICN